jgi:hypothetical protein
MTTEALLGLVMAAGGVSLALLWVLADRRKKSRRGQRFALLRGLGEASGLSLTSQELLAGGVLGFDAAKKVLLVLQFEGTRYDWYTIHLEEVTSCLVLTIYRVLPTATTNIYSINESIGEVVLQFQFSNGDPPVSVPFYSARHHRVDELPELESKVRSWQHFLSKLLENSQSDRA